MPSASMKVATQQEKDKDKDKELKNQMDVMDPFKQVVTFIEHRIRNLEKRKVKLDLYRKDQEEGKDLNGDQLAAVDKYGELLHALDISRDISKQVSQIFADTSRTAKKQQRKDLLKRAATDAERFRHIMIITNWMHRYATLPFVREDFMNGRNGAIRFSEEDIESLDELISSFTAVGLDKTLTEDDLATAGENFACLMDGKLKYIPNFSVTYAHLKGLLLSMHECGYIYDPMTANTEGEDGNQADPAPCAAIITNDGVESAPQERTQQLFPSETKADIGTPGPDMDPAVVAVSTSATPQLLNQQLATMQQVIPQTSQISTQIPDSTIVMRPDPPKPTEHIVVNMVQEARPPHESTPSPVDTWGSVGFHTPPPDDLDFLQNNFSTWESPQGTVDGVLANNHSGGYRRGGNIGRGNHNRYQGSNTNGYHARGGVNRYGNRDATRNMDSANRWSSHVQVAAPMYTGLDMRQNYEEYRGRYVERDPADYKPRNVGAQGGQRGQRGGGNGGDRYFMGGGPRNGAPYRGVNTSGSSGRRPYRGGGYSGHAEYRTGGYSGHGDSVTF